jgi:hypothetical protein
MSSLERVLDSIQKMAQGYKDVTAKMISEMVLLEHKEIVKCIKIKLCGKQCG